MRGMLEAAKALLAEAGFEACTKRLEATTGYEGTVVRWLGYTRTERYADGGECGNAVVQLIRRGTSERAVMDDSEAQARLFDAEPMPEGEGYRLVGQEIYTWPQELELDESGYYAWECKIQFHIERARA